MVTVQESVKFSSQLVEGIKEHCRHEHDKGGYEAVGFLACPKGSQVVTTRVSLNNHSPDPKTGFFVEPWEQFRAEKKLADQDYKIVGVYHSHPTSEALPSRTDRAMARPNEIMVIYSVAFDELTAWLERDGDLYRAVVLHA